MILADHSIIHVKIIYFVGATRAHVFFGEENGCSIMFDYKRKWMKTRFLITLTSATNINRAHI